MADFSKWDSSVVVLHLSLVDLRTLLFFVILKMKILVLLACALVSVKALDHALVDELLAKAKEVGLECAQSEKATPEDIEALMKHEAPPTHEGKCVIFCVSKKLHLMNDDGSVGTPSGEWLDKIKANDAELYGKMSEIYNTCKEKFEAKDDPCEAVLAYAACGKTEAEKAGIHKFIGA